MVPGDIVLVQAGVRQFHVMVFTGEGFIHAHAGLRRVVAMPGESPWPVIGVWWVIDGYSSADGNGNGDGRANRRCDRSGARAGLCSVCAIQRQGTRGAECTSRRVSDFTYCSWEEASLE